MPRTSDSGCQIWYEATGSGPPLLMVYGIGANSRRWWSRFPALLAGRYQVVMLDNRGTGQSDRPEEPWTMADMVADVTAVADALELESFHLLGCSLGSAIARHTAAANSGRIRSLSLLCPPNGIPATAGDMKLGIMWDPGRPRVDCERDSWAVLHPKTYARANTEELLADFARSESERTPGRTFRFQLGAVATAGDSNPAINAAEFPVLILHGTIDRLVPPDNARTLAAQIPRARLRWLPDASHSFWQHDADSSAAAVGEFVDGAEATWRSR